MAEYYKLWERKQIDRGIDIKTAKERIQAFRVETPSWGYGNSGTRFQVFKLPGIPGTLEEKIADAAQVHKYTGICPSVAIHIPWDKCGDYSIVAQYAQNLGMSIGAVNPNLFQEDEYKLGSLTNENPEYRRMALNHMLECVDIMKQTGSRDLSLWLADGTNYPGQGDFRARKGYLAQALKTTAAALPEGRRILVEYKMFEPAFYHTDIADWGMALGFANLLGDKGAVLCDLGHHAQGTNVEHIVANLLDEGKLGGFHFNNRKYADDDLIVGSINPYELFLIFCELIKGENDEATAAQCADIAYMIDQSHCIEPKIPAMIRSVMNIQTAHAKALMVNYTQLRNAQINNDVMAAEDIVRTAFETDVTPLLESVREEMNLHPDPMAAYLASGYFETIRHRKGGGGWG